MSTVTAQHSTGITKDKSNTAIRRIPGIPVNAVSGKGEWGLPSNCWEVAR